jgi:uncharacterized membrane protein
MRKIFSSNPALKRLSLSALVGLVVGLMLWSFDPLTRILLGWCCCVGVYLAQVWRLVQRFDAQHTRERALSFDPPGMWLLTIMLLAVAASVAVIVMLLQQGRTLDQLPRILHLALGVISLAASWFLIHTLYAFHYAHRYYQGELQSRGLYFPGRQDPDYRDFLYHSFVIGMTSQVSDVQVRSREMRRLTLVHGVLSFIFNMVVLALSINVIAGLA